MFGILGLGLPKTRLIRGTILGDIAKRSQSSAYGAYARKGTELDHSNPYTRTAYAYILLVGYDTYTISREENKIHTTKTSSRKLLWPCNPVLSLSTLVSQN